MVKHQVNTKLGVIKIKIGYIQGVGFLKDDRVYEAKQRELNVDKLFYDRLGDKVTLYEMLGYARAGDNVMIGDIRHLEVFDEYEEQVKLGKISVAESCRQINIGITTYYGLYES